MYEGTIASLGVARGFGFIRMPDQPDIFFHCSGLADGLIFDERLTELRVRFDIQQSHKGAKAINIRPA
jgi:cold shock CspA family protein